MRQGEEKRGESRGREKGAEGQRRQEGREGGREAGGGWREGGLYNSQPSITRTHYSILKWWNSQHCGNVDKQ